MCKYYWSLEVYWREMFAHYDASVSVELMEFLEDFRHEGFYNKFIKSRSLENLPLRCSDLWFDRFEVLFVSQIHDSTSDTNLSRYLQVWCTCQAVSYFNRRNLQQIRLNKICIRFLTNSQSDLETLSINLLLRKKIELYEGKFEEFSILVRAIWTCFP